MKQKNLILMVVAVGCGLAAAFLSSTMSAKTQTETVPVWVAAKDLPVGSMITKDELSKMVKIKKIPKDALPPLYVADEKDLVDKRLSRAVRADETFNPKDLNTGGVVTLPPGMDMMSVAVSLTDAVSGFVTPGSRVDLLGTCQTRDNPPRHVAFPLLVDMLVLAVDAATTLPSEKGTFAALNTVSFAVNREQALLLQLAKSRNCGMSLVLRNDNKQGIEEFWQPKDVLKFLEDGTIKGNPVVGAARDGDPIAKPVADAPKVTTVKLPVATEDVPAGTELTADVLKKFILKDVPAPAPDNAVTDLAAVTGKILQNGVAANQWISKAYVGDYAPGKIVPKEEFAPGAKDGAVEEKEPAAGRKTHDVVVQSGSGHRTFRYEEKTPGNWVLVGEVTKDGEPRSPAAEPKADKGEKSDKADGKPGTVD